MKQLSTIYKYAAKFYGIKSTSGVHEAPYCMLAGMEFPSFDDLVREDASPWVDEILAELPEDLLDGYVCEAPECGKLFKKKPKLIEHFKLAHTRSISIAMCEMCQFSTKRVAEMRRHSRKMHQREQWHLEVRRNKNYTSPKKWRPTSGVTSHTPLASDNSAHRSAAAAVTAALQADTVAMQDDATAAPMMNVDVVTVDHIHVIAQPADTATTSASVATQAQPSTKDVGVQAGESGFSSPPSPGYYNMLKKDVETAKLHQQEASRQLEVCQKALLAADAAYWKRKYERLAAKLKSEK